MRESQENLKPTRNVGCRKRDLFPVFYRMVTWLTMEQFTLQLLSVRELVRSDCAHIAVGRILFHSAHDRGHKGSMPTSSRCVHTVYGMRAIEVCIG
jgi:hypothetical protein